MTGPEHPRAPDLPGEAIWIHTPGPLSLVGELAGHVVLLAFWAPGDVHCQNLVPTLAFVQHVFADRPFVVVVVYTPRLPAECDPEFARDAVRRHGMRWPVLLDTKAAAWRDYDVRAWPTLALVDAHGRLRFRGAGEPDRARLTRAVELLLEEGAESRRLSPDPWNGLSVVDDEPTGPLWYPAGLAFDAERELLWVADTGQHRVLAVHPESGEVQRVLGCGLPGAADGRGEEAAFFLPRGLAVHEDTMWICDTGNHLLRQVSLIDDEVVTVLGQGRPVRDGHGGGYGSEQGIDAPMGACWFEGSVYVSLAGMHQIWCVDPETGVGLVFAGSGRRGLADGDLDLACLAQPAGMTLRKGCLVFVDADGHAVRELDVHDGSVRTLAGGGPTAFGNVDGPAQAARFQLPLDVVAVDAERLLVADTYNDRVRELREGRVETLGGAVRLRRPEAVCAHGDRVWLAETGGHVIRTGSLAGGDFETLTIRGVEPAPFRRVVAARPVRLRSLSDATLRVELRMPAGACLHPMAPVRAWCENAEGHSLLLDLAQQPDVEGGVVVLRGLPTGEDGRGTWSIRLRYLTCHDQEAVAHVQEQRWSVPVELAPGGAGEVALEPVCES